MKIRFFVVAAAVLTVAACKTPYKATDRPMNSTDTTASATDTSGVMQKTTSPTDTSVSKMEPAKMDSINKPVPDSMAVPTKTDTVMMQPAPDSALIKPEFDSTRVPPNTDSAKMTRNEMTTPAPAEIEAVFTKQYPGATNIVWSRYDSLAAVPIDMRLTGWKKMDTLDHMVKFDHKGESYYAWYDSEGKWIGSASPMEDFTKLPDAVTKTVNNAIKTRYTGYTISSVNREFQTGGKKTYEVELTR